MQKKEYNWCSHCLMPQPLVSAVYDVRSGRVVIMKALSQGSFWKSGQLGYCHTRREKPKHVPDNTFSCKGASGLIISTIHYPVFSRPKRCSVQERRNTAVKRSTGTNKRTLLQLLWPRRKSRGLCEDGGAWRV